MSEQNNKIIYLICLISFIGTIVFSIWFGIENNKNRDNLKTDEEKQRYKLHLAILCTLLIIFGIFFAGSAIYLSFFSNNEKQYSENYLTPLVSSTDFTPPSTGTRTALNKSFPIKDDMPPLLEL